ncbi:hypothetical protein V6N13_022917 [Hibiscus sabdariffa]
MVKVNFDASLIPASSIAFLGCVIRDHEGFILEANCTLLYNAHSSFVAEAQAVVLNCTFNFIPRVGKSVTHAMARECSSLFEDCTWVEEAPTSVESATVEDRRWIDPP